MPRASRLQAMASTTRILRLRIVACLMVVVVVAGCGLVGTPEVDQTAELSTLLDEAEGTRSVALPDPVLTLPPEPATEPEPPPVPDDRVDLAHQIAELVALWVDEGERATWSVLVTDQHGRDVYALEPDTARLPASVLKVVTAAAAFVTFGTGAGLPTHLEATAAPSNGNVAGDLVVVGRGDPALATEQFTRWVYPIRPATHLDQLADAVAAAGIRRIDGDVVGVSDATEGPSLATGWPARYLAALDARHASGLSVDAGLRTIFTWPAEPPEGPGADEPLGEVEPDDVTVELAPDPAAQAASELRRLLIERGVEVTGVARSGDHANTVVRIGSLDGVPISELVRFALEQSDNHMADGLFRALGAAWVGEASWDAGAIAVTRSLASLGITLDGAVLADGSGLSRNNRLTARQLVEVDRVMSRGPMASDWNDSMAILGRTGTLGRRLVGSVAEGRFLGKTGSLRDVRSISGTMLEIDVATGGDLTATDERWHMAVIVNDVQGRDLVVSRRLMDELILILATHGSACSVERDAALTQPGIPHGELMVVC